MAPLKIAIIGGGPSGLTLARLLSVNSILPTIFERDPTSSHRPQGGTLDLHAETGQLALQEAGLHETFLTHVQFDREDFLMTTKDLQHLVEERHDQEHPQEPEPDRPTRDRPEIDRTVLRAMLLDSLPKGCIRWDAKVERVEPVSVGYSITLADGSTHGPYDLIVGADGAWSRVRPLIHGIAPAYSGVSFLELCHSAASLHQSVDNFVGRGSVFAFSNGKGIQAQRLGDNSIRVYASVKHADAEYVNTLKSKEDVLPLYNDWAPVLQDCVRLADAEVIPRALYQFPTGISWQNKKGLTLIGDAAHLITPMAGEGVNLAMKDALELSKAIIAASKGGDLQMEVQTFEKDMFARAKEAAEETGKNLEAMFSEEYPENMGPILAAMGGPPQEERWTVMVTCAIG